MNVTGSPIVQTEGGNRRLARWLLESTVRKLSSCAREGAKFNVNHETALILFYVPGRSRDPTDRRPPPYKKSGNLALSKATDGNGSWPSQGPVGGTSATEGDGRRSRREVVTLGCVWRTIEVGMDLPSITTHIHRVP